MRLFKRLTLVAFLFSLILPGKLYAQGVPPPDENLLSGFDWRYVGPAIAGGRITDVEIVLDDHPIGSLVLHLEAFLNLEIGE